MAVGTIQNVDPSTLTIALNVRTDVKLDKSFVASIKELGILQPPMVTAAEGGGLEVVLGQRRVLGAVEAGLKEIPVYVVDESEANAARVVDQLTENDQRQGLSEAERMGGYKQLSLFGVSPAQIAKRTSTDRKVVDTALAVAGDETAVQAFTEYELTLDQASYLVEFADDSQAVKDLVKAAAKGQLDHVAADLRKKRVRAQLVASLEAELKSEKVIPMLPTDSSYGGAQEGDPAGLVRIDKLGKPADPTVELEPADVPKKLLAGRVAQTWGPLPDGSYGQTAFKQYFVLNPAENGFPEQERTAYVPRELTPEEQVAADERKAEEAARETAKAAIVTAAEVRQDWLVSLLQRKTLPEVLPFIAKAQLLVDPRSDDLFLNLLGLVSEDVDRTLEDPKGALRALLASTLSGVEECVRPRYYYGGISDDVLTALELYLPQLVEWGYGLSDAENGLLDRAAALAAGESVDADDDEDEFGDDFDPEDADEA